MLQPIGYTVEGPVITFTIEIDGPKLDGMDVAPRLQAPIMQIGRRLVVFCEPGSRIALKGGITSHTEGARLSLKATGLAEPIAKEDATYFVSFNFDLGRAMEVRRNRFGFVVVKAFHAEPMGKKPAFSLAAALGYAPQSMVIHFRPYVDTKLK